MASVGRLTKMSHLFFPSSVLDSAECVQVSFIYYLLHLIPLYD